MELSTESTRLANKYWLEGTAYEHRSVFVFGYDCTPACEERKEKVMIGFSGSPSLYSLTPEAHRLSSRVKSLCRS